MNAPMSIPYVPTATQCEAIRCSSAMITRIVATYGETSIARSFSTASA